MLDLLKELFNFLAKHLSAEGVAILLLAVAFVYIWFQHHRLKLLEERVRFIDQKREIAVRELEDRSRLLPVSDQRPNRVSETRNVEGPKSVLVADDERAVGEIIRLYISEHVGSVSTTLVGDGTAVIKAIEHKPPALLILDLIMPGKSGYEVLSEIDRRGYRFPVLVISAYATSKQEVAERARISRQRFEFLTKPFELKEFIGTVKELLARE